MSSDVKPCSLVYGYPSPHHHEHRKSQYSYIVRLTMLTTFGTTTRFPQLVKPTEYKINSIILNTFKNNYNKTPET
jgi:hypothetical protein